MARRIDTYALIGDCETAALVGQDGSIDWLCWPRFDSDACFAALLGRSEHGRWKIAPAGRVTNRQRRYRGDTLILETELATEEGTVALVDFMPIRGHNSDIIRVVYGRSGRMRMQMELAPRFDYGRLLPWLEQMDECSLRIVTGPHAAVLRANEPLDYDRGTVRSEFTLCRGERAHFVLTYYPSHLAVPDPVDAERASTVTETFWREWSDRCAYRGRWSAAVRRSLVTIKAMTYRPTGGIVAAPTTSLPELQGGTRNWDYRFCWLRDATFVVACLLKSGYHEEARAWREWLLRAAAALPSQIQPIYGIGCEHRLTEEHISWLPGVDGSRPVRIGNAAHAQFQLDIFGELMNAMHVARHSHLRLDESGWALQSRIVDHVGKVWQEPDAGIWESRAGKRHFTQSKVMAWVAVDRAVKAAEDFGLDGPVELWRALRERIHADICVNGFDRDRGAFVQAFGSKELDAATLMIPMVGFLPAGDSRVRGTVAAIERELMRDGFVMRYDSERTDDGLPSGEGSFLACNFWLAENYAMQGRQREAETLFNRLLSLRNDVGLLAEEYEPRSNSLMGNFPQALSHLALVNAAHRLSARPGSSHASLSP